MLSPITVSGSGRQGVLTLKAINNVDVNADITATGNARFGFTAYSTQHGAVRLNGFRIATNGGNIHLGRGQEFVQVRGVLHAGTGSILIEGSATPASLAANQLSSVILRNACITAQMVQIRGSSPQSLAADGVSVFNSQINTDTGGIDIDGVANRGYFSGVYFEGSTLTSKGLLKITGQAQGVDSNGVTIDSSRLQTTDAAAVNVTGTIGSGDNESGIGVCIRNGSLIQSLGTGTIALTGIDQSQNKNGLGLSIAGNSSVKSQQARIGLSTDTLTLTNSSIQTGSNGVIDILSLADTTSGLIGGVNAHGANKVMGLNASFFSGLSAGTVNIGSLLRPFDRFDTAAPMTAPSFANITQVNFYARQRMNLQHGIDVGATRLGVTAGEIQSITSAVIRAYELNLNSTHGGIGSFQNPLNVNASSIATHSQGSQYVVNQQPNAVQANLTSVQGAIDFLATQASINMHEVNAATGVNIVSQGQRVEIDQIQNQNGLIHVQAPQGVIVTTVDAGGAGQVVLNSTQSTVNVTGVTSPQFGYFGGSQCGFDRLYRGQ